MPGEFDFLDWIRSQQKPNELVNVGIGDDLAVLNWPKDDLLIVGVDQVLEGVHFDSKIHSPRAIGQKAMNRNLSDCAAMACLPAAAVVTLALPKGSGGEFARELYEGMRDAADKFDCSIVGGDTGSWNGQLVVSVTILGRSAGQKPITRSGARAGDVLFVTGPLGGGILGRHMTFQPRVILARELAKNFEIHAMVDLSDGLGRDLRNLCLASKVGAEIDTAALPVHDDVKRLTDDKSPIVHAMSDGEDYELLIASSAKLPAPCIPIGRVTSNLGLVIQDGKSKTSLEWSAIPGWEHSL
jgi:thiamine-monophosphate kinase